MRQSVCVLRWAFVLGLLSGSVVAACAGAGDKSASPLEAASAGKAGDAMPAAAPAAGPLENTNWRLVEFQSMDDAVGTMRPSDPALYTMQLNADGSVAMRLNCNRATVMWNAEPSTDPSSGRFMFAPLAATKALCPPPSIDKQIAADAAHIRSYLLKNGRLHLSLMADGGIYTWESVTDVPFETAPYQQREAAILKASPYTRALVDAGGATGPGRYVYSRVDLDGDGRDEVFVYLLGSVFCGSGGCTLQLFTPGRDGYALVSEFTISRTPVIVSPRKTGGWSDIFKPESGGGAPASYVRYTFDGKQYVERERIAADKAPDGKRCLAGDLTFDKGIPLEPTETVAPGRGPVAPAPSKTGFSTVCGVSVGGKVYRYRCTVEGAAPGKSGTTILHFPDNAVTITWLGGSDATATFAGMVPKSITVSTADGVTRFPFEDKVYFYASDYATAAAQLRTLR